MRSSHVTSAWLLSPLLVLLVATACAGSAVRADAPIEDSTASTTSSADEAVVTEAVVADVPEVQADVEEETTVLPSQEEESASATKQDVQQEEESASAAEQDIQVTDQPASVALDSPANLEGTADDVSSVRMKLESGDQKEGDGKASPAVVKSDEVNYSGWTVLKVTGFTDSSDAGEPVEDEDEDAVARQTEQKLESPDSEYPLLDLEERVGVRVLQENRIEGFYELAVSPAALEAVIDDLTARGFQVEDRKIDLGVLMDQATIPSLRKILPKGEATFDSYMTYEEIEDFIRAFEEKNPHTVTRQVIGKSVEGRDIHMLTLSMGGRNCRSLEKDSSSSEDGSRRESRQINSSPTAVQQALAALTNIIRWGNTMDREADIKRASNEYQQQEANQTLQEEETVNPFLKPIEGSPLEQEAISATDILLEKIMQNIPYGYQTDDSDQNGNGTGGDTIKHTYDALQEIMSGDKDQADDYVTLDSTNQPEAVQLTYKVLQRIMNHDSNNPRRRPYKNTYFRDGQNRVSKSLQLADDNSTDPISSNANETSTDDSEIEADILFLLSTFIPKEYTKNSTIVESIKQSLIIISKLLPKDGNLTQEVIDELAPQVVSIPGVVGVSSSSVGSDSRSELVIKLANLIMARDDMNRNEPVQRMANCKPVIFLDGGIHAREWISPAFLVYTLTQLVKNTPLLLGAEWRVVPVLNPDGYVHTWTKDRLWRKNKATNAIGCAGVDLNRNFGYKFGGSGTSTRTCSEIYRGEKAFSEPETSALKAAVEEVKDRLKAYVTVHSYGQMILHPWGYAKTYHPNDEQLTSMGKGMASAIEQVYGTSYVVGSAARVLYSAAGGSDDWVASLGVPYSFTLELRDSGRYGFVLPASKIKPTVVETWSAMEYLGNRIINENPRSASPTTKLSADQSDQDTLLINTIDQTTGITEPVRVEPFAPLVPIKPGFGAAPSFPGQGTPLFYSAAVLPRKPVVNDATQEKRPTAQNSPFQVPPRSNIPQSLQYFNPGYQALQVPYSFVAVPQGQANQEVKAQSVGRPMLSDSVPNVSILRNQQANVQLSPFGSVSQSLPYDMAFAQNQVSGNAPLLPVYPKPIFSPQASSPDQYNSFGNQADKVRDEQIVDYLSQVLSSLYRNEALTSSAGLNQAFTPQEPFDNSGGAYPIPYVVQNPYWNVPQPPSTPLRQSAYGSEGSSNPSYDGNSNVFIPYNSPMVVRTTTDFSENQQFPFPRQQFQNPEQNVQNFQPATLEQFLNPEQNTNSFSSSGGFSNPAQFPNPSFHSFRPSFPSPARPNFKTDIDQVFRQNPNEHIEEQRLRHHFNAEYHRNSPVLVSLGNPYSEQSPSYSNRFDLSEGEIGQLTPMISYPRALGSQQFTPNRGYEVPQHYRQ